MQKQKLLLEELKAGGREGRKQQKQEEKRKIVAGRNENMRLRGEVSNKRERKGKNCCWRDLKQGVERKWEQQ